MITLKNKEIEFTFEVAGYQYPDIKEDPYGYDCNWLNITISLTDGYKTCRAEDPALLAEELRTIAAWFLTISKNEIPDCIILRTMEQTIAFQLYFKKDDIITFAVMLSTPFKPDNFDGGDNPYACSGNEYTIFFDYSFDDLKRISDEFFSEYNQYPERDLSKNL